MNNRRNGILSLVVLGGFYAWRNRYRIQQFLESRGIDIPIFGNRVTDRLMSVGAKTSGSVEHGMRSMDNDTRKAV